MTTRRSSSPRTPERNSKLAACSEAFTRCGGGFVCGTPHDVGAVLVVSLRDGVVARTRSSVAQLYAAGATCKMPCTPGRDDQLVWKENTSLLSTNSLSRRNWRVHHIPINTPGQRDPPAARPLPLLSVLRRDLVVGRLGRRCTWARSLAGAHDANVSETQRQRHNGVVFWQAHWEHTSA